ncbi:uncharacterized protein PHALS_11193 [Plasmopara halstedii]|uniref:Uncharacterized protein n=1 Tax=Plasmopara halstedii TaxID=4781 RepID=A0A0P1AK92_PLAHL|nr:uncharacterized protein PHALS_11193 [Plasmopara halstedii]CEG41023.1 hypothetical protein PHALS_11193 [Plasmopara halstedii]|eukprot:XP_024577392.1 hypothetical protein PHALS_11193 [Plasmopara halstedii]
MQDLVDQAFNSSKVDERNEKMHMKLMKTDVPQQTNTMRIPAQTRPTRTDVYPEALTQSIWTLQVWIWGSHSKWSIVNSDSWCQC